MKKMCEELCQLSMQDLEVRIDEMRRSLFSLKLNKVTSHVKDISQFKKLRRDIARGMCILEEKQKEAFFAHLMETFKAMASESQGDSHNEGLVQERNAHE